MIRAIVGSTATVVAMLAGVSTAPAAPSPPVPIPGTATSGADPSPTGSPGGTASPTVPGLPTTSPSGIPTTSPSGTPTDSPTVSPTLPPVPTSEPSPSDVTPPQRAAAAVVTLDAPSPARQWEDRPVTLTGRLAGGQSWYVSMWRRTNAGWVRIAYVRAVNGAFKAVVRPPAASTWTVKAVLGASPSDPWQSATRSFTVLNRTLTLNKPAAAYTALTNVTLTGRITPAEPGRRVVLDYSYNHAWRALAVATVDAAGNYRIRVPDNFPYHWIVRVRTLESPAAAVEYSTTNGYFDVKAYLWPQVYSVAAKDIPYTYRSGCPVGPSQLRRLVLTHWGLDKRLHRGELIVRDAASQRMIAVWNAAILKRFPVRGMHRVDVYKGSDIKAMEADNTSVFNCRSVTGNPYALSPHSYGYAIDINTVENPYKAVNGVWYPSNGRSFIKRTPSRPGMLFWSSTPTKALYQQGYFWGATWNNPDYQHFQPR